MTTSSPTGKYRAIEADPPWPYATYSHKGKGRSAEAHYDTMSIEAIAGMPVAQWATDDAVLFLWVTKPILPRVFEVIEAWGFHYKTIGFCWAKTYGDEVPPRFCIGLGHWTRSNTENCLLATRGKPHRIHKDVPELIVAPRREHSRKPDEIYERIERLVPGPYLELFASSSTVHRKGWTHIVGKDRALVRRWPSSGYPDAEATDPKPG